MVIPTFHENSIVNKFLTITSEHFKTQLALMIKLELKSIPGESQIPITFSISKTKSLAESIDLSSDIALAISKFFASSSGASRILNIYSEIQSITGNQSTFSKMVDEDILKAVRPYNEGEKNKTEDYIAANIEKMNEFITGLSNRTDPQNSPYQSFVEGMSCLNFVFLYIQDAMQIITNLIAAGKRVRIASAQWALEDVKTIMTQKGGILNKLKLLFVSIETLIIKLKNSYQTIRMNNLSKNADTESISNILNIFTSVKTQTEDIIKFFEGAENGLREGIRLYVPDCSDSYIPRERFTIPLQSLDTSNIVSQIIQLLSDMGQIISEIFAGKFYDLSLISNELIIMILSLPPDITNLKYAILLIKDTFKRIDYRDLKNIISLLKIRYTTNILTQIGIQSELNEMMTKIESLDEDTKNNDNQNINIVNQITEAIHKIDDIKAVVTEQVEGASGAQLLIQNLHIKVQSISGLVNYQQITNANFAEVSEVNKKNLESYKKTILDNVEKVAAVESSINSALTKCIDTYKLKSQYTYLDYLYTKHINKLRNAINKFEVNNTELQILQILINEFYEYNYKYAESILTYLESEKLRAYQKEKGLMEKTVDGSLSDGQKQIASLHIASKINDVTLNIASLNEQIEIYKQVKQKYQTKPTVTKNNIIEYIQNVEYCMLNSLSDLSPNIIADIMPTNITEGECGEFIQTMNSLLLGQDQYNSVKNIILESGNKIQIINQEMLDNISTNHTKASAAAGVVRQKIDRIRQLVSNKEQPNFNILLDRIRLFFEIFRALQCSCILESARFEPLFSVDKVLMAANTQDFCIQVQHILDAVKAKYMAPNENISNHISSQSFIMSLKDLNFNINSYLLKIANKAIESVYKQYIQNKQVITIIESPAVATLIANQADPRVRNIISNTMTSLSTLSNYAKSYMLGDKVTEEMQIQAYASSANLAVSAIEASFVLYGMNVDGYVQECVRVMKNALQAWFVNIKDNTTIKNDSWALNTEINSGSFKMRRAFDVAHDAYIKITNFTDSNHNAVANLTVEYIRAAYLTASNNSKVISELISDTVQKLNNISSLKSSILKSSLHSPINITTLQFDGKNIDMLNSFVVNLDSIQSFITPGSVDFLLVCVGAGMSGQPPFLLQNDQLRTVLAKGLATIINQIIDIVEIESAAFDIRKNINDGFKQIYGIVKNGQNSGGLIFNLTEDLKRNVLQNQNASNISQLDQTLNRLSVSTYGESGQGTDFWTTWDNALIKINLFSQFMVELSKRDKKIYQLFSEAKREAEQQEGTLKTLSESKQIAITDVEVKIANLSTGSIHNLLYDLPAFTENSATDAYFVLSRSIQTVHTARTNGNYIINYNGLRDKATDYANNLLNLVKNNDSTYAKIDGKVCVGINITIEECANLIKKHCKAAESEINAELGITEYNFNDNDFYDTIPKLIMLQIRIANSFGIKTEPEQYDQLTQVRQACKFRETRSRFLRGFSLKFSEIKKDTNLYILRKKLKQLYDNNHLSVKIIEKPQEYESQPDQRYMSSLGNMVKKIQESYNLNVALFQDLIIQYANANLYQLNVKLKKRHSEYSIASYTVSIQDDSTYKSIFVHLHSLQKDILGHFGIHKHIEHLNMDVNKYLDELENFIRSIRDTVVSVGQPESYPAHYIKTEINTLRPLYEKVAHYLEDPTIYNQCIKALFEENKWNDFNYIFHHTLADIHYIRICKLLKRSPRQPNDLTIGKAIDIWHIKGLIETYKKYSQSLNITIYELSPIVENPANIAEHGKNAVILINTIKQYLNGVDKKVNEFRWPLYLKVIIILGSSLLVLTVCILVEIAIIGTSWEKYSLLDNRIYGLIVFFLTTLSMALIAKKLRY